MRDDHGRSDDAVDFTAAYADALASLAVVRIDRPAIEHVLDELLIVTQQAMQASIAISVTARSEDGSLTTSAATSDAVRDVDAFEYSIEEGPCIATLATGAEQLLQDVATDRRWPRFGAYAADAGFASVAGIPLRVAGSTIGALDLYANEPAGLEADLHVARRLAAPASSVLANGRVYHRTRRLNTELEAKLDELAVVNQAVGVLMSRRKCDVETAKKLLVATAEATGRSLEETAGHVVGGERPGDMGR